MSLCHQFWFQGYATWSVLDQRAEDNLSILKTILEEQESIPPSNDIENKARLFYHTCMKWSETSKTTLHNIIEETGGWNLTGNPSDMSSFDLMTKILEVHKFTTSSLFQWYDICHWMTWQMSYLSWHLFLQGCSWKSRPLFGVWHVHLPRGSYVTNSWAIFFSKVQRNAEEIHPEGSQTIAKRWPKSSCKIQRRDWKTSRWSGWVWKGIR